MTELPTGLADRLLNSSVQHFYAVLLLSTLLQVSAVHCDLKYLLAFSHFFLQYIPCISNPILGSASWQTHNNVDCTKNSPETWRKVRGLGLGYSAHNG